MNPVGLNENAHAAFKNQRIRADRLLSLYKSSVMISPSSCLLLLCVVSLASAWTSLWTTLKRTPTLIIGHRGEKSLAPEHTLASYYFAAIAGADYVEPDLVMTNDGIPVCIHDLGLMETTDVDFRPEFRDRKRTIQLRVADDTKNALMFDYFPDDFSLAELKTLRTKQAAVGVRPMFLSLLAPSPNQNYFSIPTFEEYLELIRSLERNITERTGKKYHIGLIPELKAPEYFRKAFIETPRVFEDTVLDILEGRGLLGDPSPVKPLIIQNFDSRSLLYIHKRLISMPGQRRKNVRLLQLVDEQAAMLTRIGLGKVFEHADIIGVWKGLLSKEGIEHDLRVRGIRWDEDAIAKLGGFLSRDEIMKMAHDSEKEVSVFTVHSSYEPTERSDGKTKEEELWDLFSMGVDSVFCEGVSECISVRDTYEAFHEGRASAVRHGIKMGKNKFRYN